MSAPQRVDPARIRRANRAQTVANIATAVIWAGLALMVAGLLANAGAISGKWIPAAPLGMLVMLPSFVVSLLAGQLADRYRQPVNDGEGEQ
ncbi:hypothetical protein [Micromonospora sp. NPDC050695]|uniref:hypothetical protein n=1 Tax=Micromonospora sp. NPDC050695 TaxID=3154938 RepID=UPI0033F8570A